jgi:hypothetical protein
MPGCRTGVFAAQAWSATDSVGARYCQVIRLTETGAVVVAALHRSVA